MAGNGQDWFYHSPASKGKSERVNVPPASQIPGLSQLIPDDHANDRQQSRSCVRDSDSKYIKLAKQGGRKNLLQFHQKDTSSKEAQPYPRVHWFDHQQMTREQEQQILARSAWIPPDYMRQQRKTPAVEGGGGGDPTTDQNNDGYDDGVVTPAATVEFDPNWARHEGKSNQRKYSTRDAPFHTGSNQQEPREETPKMSRNCSVVSTAPKLSRNCSVVSNAPKLSRNCSVVSNASWRKDSEVDFEKLISGGYGDEWLNQREAVRNKQLKKWSSINNGNQDSMTEHQKGMPKKQNLRQKLKPLPHQMSTKSQQESSSSNDGGGLPWKLSKFNKVKAKVCTRS